MKAGNKKQAAILSVVAVGAIGFLIYQLVPSKVGNLAAAITGSGSNAAAAPSSAPDNLSLLVLGAPFSHPKLAAKPVVALAAPQMPSDINKNGKDPFNPGAPTDANSSTTTPAGPDESAGEGQQEKKGPSIRVTAIMIVDQPIAMLSVDGGDAKQYSEGDQLSDRTRLISIGESSVTVRINGALHQIATGQTYGGDTQEKK
jgi:hypothetical protein